MTPCTRTRASRAVTTAAAATAALITPLAAPAAADPATTLALLAVAQVWPETFTPTSASVCARGYVDHGSPTVGQWVYRFVGPTAHHITPGGGSAFPKTCYALTTTGVATGTTEASLQYVGIGGDVIASCVAALTWAPGVRLTWVHHCADDGTAP